MSIRLDIDGEAGGIRFYESAANIAANTHFGIEKAFWQSGKDITAEFSKQVLAKNKTGRLYIIRKRKHRASAPGETPANITGNYRKSVGFQVNQGTNPQLVIGNSAEYAGFLEMGTSRMKRRPGLRNSIKSSERDIIRNLSTDIFEAI